jgi:hypothetical protein
MKQHTENEQSRKQSENEQSLKHSENEQSRKQTEKETGIRQPDPETLHTTDPQEHMKGPISSFMQGVKNKAEKNNEQDRNDPELQSAEHTRKHGDKKDK